MTIEQLVEKEAFEVVVLGDGREREITEIFCCDLLSVAMSRAPASGLWVTVMGNMNTLAVASLTEVGCVVLAEGAVLDEMAMKKAEQEEITVLKTEKPVFKAALAVHKWLQVEQ